MAREHEPGAAPGCTESKRPPTGLHPQRPSETGHRRPLQDAGLPAWPVWSGSTLCTPDVRTSLGRYSRLVASCPVSSRRGSLPDAAPRPQDHCRPCVVASGHPGPPWATGPRAGQPPCLSFRGGCAAHARTSPIVCPSFRGVKWVIHRFPDPGCHACTEILLCECYSALSRAKGERLQWLPADGHATLR
jgi:hypothetical protein